MLCQKISTSWEKIAPAGWHGWHVFATLLTDQRSKKAIFLKLWNFEKFWFCQFFVRLMTVFLLKNHPSFTCLLTKKNWAHWEDIILWNSRNLWAIITSADWSPPLGGVAASPRPNPADQWSEQRPTSCFPSIATHWYLLAHYLPVRKKTRLIVGKCDTRWLDCSHPQDRCINYSDWSKL